MHSQDEELKVLRLFLFINFTWRFNLQVENIDYFRLIPRIFGG